MIMMIMMIYITLVDAVYDDEHGDDHAAAADDDSWGIFKADIDVNHYLRLGERKPMTRVSR